MPFAYDKSYLGDVQKNLGFLFQFLLCSVKLSADDAQKAFFKSEIPDQIEVGNPDFLCGKSGYELAMLVLKDRDISADIQAAIKEPFYPQAEYWSGYVLAYCQWKNNVPFQKILTSFPLGHFLDSYGLLHEADVSKIEEIVMSSV